LLAKNLDAGRLRFTTSFAEIGEFGQVHFLCVGTPQKPGEDRGGPQHALRRGGRARAAPDREALIVGKSTVPVGTARDLLALAQAGAPAGAAVSLLWKP